MSPPASSALLRAMDNPSPMPPRLNEMVGSNSVLRACGVESGTGVVNLDRHFAAFCSRDSEHYAAGFDGLGSVLEQVGEHALDQILVGENLGDRGRESRRIDYFRMGGTQQGDALFEQRIDIQRFRRDGRFARKLGERAHAPLQAEYFVHDDLGGLLVELAAVARLPRRDFFHGEADGRQRVLHFVRHLARQRLPAFQARHVDQALLRLLQLVGHVVESLNGRADFVVARRWERDAPDFRPPLPKARW